MKYFIKTGILLDYVGKEENIDKANSIKLVNKKVELVTSNILILLLIQLFFYLFFIYFRVK